MCTVSWRGGGFEGGVEPFELFFNRDEQRSREAAQPPISMEARGLKALFPVDPVGGGTWVGANVRGMVICVLNDYRTKLKEGRENQQLKSRGLLVKESLGCQSISEVEQFVREQVADHEYAPFRLLCFDVVGRERRLWWWNQDDLTIEDGFSCPVTSSSWRSEEVEERRKALFDELVRDGKETLECYQSHQFLGEKEWSVCMSRELTQTVSLTRVRVDEKNVTFRYAPRDGESGFLVGTEEQHLPLKYQ